jgi:ectoine hydroxylase-related dioxygenase (phytanoyl-CoA dioxygenase family)
VVDTDARNGAIDVLPGTHRQFYPFWRYALERKYRLTTRVPLARGDVLVRWSTLWHRGMPNKSGTPRPMMSFTFGERGAPTGDPFAGDPYFYPNWYSNGSRLSVLRERLEAAAPVTRSAVRF